MFNIIYGIVHNIVSNIEQYYMKNCTQSCSQNCQFFFNIVHNIVQMPSISRLMQVYPPFSHCLARALFRIAFARRLQAALFSIPALASSSARTNLIAAHSCWTLCRGCHDAFAFSFSQPGEVGVRKIQNSTKDVRDTGSPCSNFFTFSFCRDSDDFLFFDFVASCSSAAFAKGHALQPASFVDTDRAFQLLSASCSILASASSSSAYSAIKAWISSTEAPCSNNRQIVFKN